MKVMFDVPEKYVELAKATLISNAKDYEEKRIRKAASICKKKRNFIPTEKIGEPTEDIKQMYLAFAIMSIACMLDEIPREGEE